MDESLKDNRLPDRVTCRNLLVAEPMILLIEISVGYFFLFFHLHINIGLITDCIAWRTGIRWCENVA